MPVVYLKPEKSKYTYNDYLKWPDDKKWELIEGVPYDMSPAPSTQHQRVAGELFFQIKRFLNDTISCEVFFAPFDVRFAKTGETDEEITDVVQPDITVICDSSKIDERGCRGAPDWIIEVLSPYTTSKDFIQKRKLYEDNGVKEYWLVHPRDLMVTVFNLQKDGKYGKPSYYTGDTPIDVNTLQPLSIDFETVFRHP